jgi:hypothetical protein
MYWSITEQIYENWFVVRRFKGNFFWRCMWKLRSTYSRYTGLWSKPLLSYDAWPIIRNNYLYAFNYVVLEYVMVMCVWDVVRFHLSKFLKIVTSPLDWFPECIFSVDFEWRTIFCLYVQFLFSRELNICAGCVSKSQDAADQQRELSKQVDR